MKRMNWFIKLGLFLLGSSLLIYLSHFLIFRDSYFISKYVLAQLGFLPLNVFLVTVVLNQLMIRRAHRDRMQKLNMLIGVFFSDVGTELLRYLSDFSQDIQSIRKDLLLSDNWLKQDYIMAKNKLLQWNPGIDSKSASLKKLQTFLIEKHNHLLRFLENPNLIEHEHFTELLWAVFHLLDELKMRTDLQKLSPSDYAHISSDISRVNTLLILQWLDYMKYLQDNYPYMYSLAIKNNPFASESGMVLK